MIIFVRDINGDIKNAKEVAATLAGYAAATSLRKSCLVLQFTTHTDNYKIEDLVRTNKEIQIMSEYQELQNTGMDALLTAATGEMSQNDFFFNVNTYFKGRRFDVASATTNVSFLEVLEDQREQVFNLFKYAKLYYNYIFVVLGGASLSDIFGDYAYNLYEDPMNPEVATEEGVEAKIDLTIWTIRQGAKPREHRMFDNELYVITDYDSRSKFTLGEMGKLLGIKKKPIFGLSKPVGYRDAMDMGRLGKYLREKKQAYNVPCDDAAVWSQQLFAILQYLMGKAPKFEDFFDYAEIPEELFAAPQAPEDVKPLTRKERKEEEKRKKAEEKEAKKNAKKNKADAE